MANMLSEMRVPNITNEFTNPAGTHLIPETSPRQHFQDVQYVNSEDVHKT